MTSKNPFQRILLKISGELLTSSEQSNNPLLEMGLSIKKLVEQGIEISLVVGGGNIFRGRDAKSINMERTKADHAGLLATMINGLFVEQTFKNLGIDCEVLSALQMPQVFELYHAQKASKYLSQKKVVVLVAGIGTPYFSTDTAAVLRALEINAQVILKGTKVDGVFRANPSEDSTSEKYHQVSCSTILEDRLNCMDMTAVALAREHNLPIIIFNLFKDGALEKAVFKKSIGTYVEGI